jgi:hypothetical protein
LFTGQQVTKRDVLSKLEELGQIVADKTVSRDLEVLVKKGKIKKIKHGVWDVI